MTCSTPGSPVLHYLLESAQIHVHRVDETISASVVPFSSCLQSFPASGSFPTSQLFASVGQSIGASASMSVLPMNMHKVLDPDWEEMVRIRLKASPPSTEKETEFGNTFLPTHLKLFSPYSKNGFLGGSVVKNPPANEGGSGETDSIPRSGKSPGGGNGNPPQYSCQEYPMDRGTWWAIVHGVTKSQTWLSTFPNYFSYHQRCPLTLRNTVLIYELGHRYSEKEESASCRRHWEVSKKDEGGRGIREEGRQGSCWHEHMGKWKTIQSEQRCSSGKEGNEVRWVERRHVTVPQVRKGSFDLMPYVIGSQGGLLSRSTVWWRIVWWQYSGEG